MSELSPKQQVVQLIREAKKILLLPQARPDGDDIGCCLAMHMFLNKLDKETDIICQSGVPKELAFLPKSEVVKKELSLTRDFVIQLKTADIEVDKLRYEQKDKTVQIIVTPKDGEFSVGDLDVSSRFTKYDLIISFDCAEAKLLGDVYAQNKKLFFETPFAVIDHHASNTRFGQINLIDTTAASTTEILVGIFEALSPQANELIDSDIATCLLTGIIYDTGSFQHQNTTPKSFTVAAGLLARGARQNQIIRHLFKTRDLTTLKLWGRILSKMQEDHTHKFVWSLVTRKDFEECQSSEDQIGNIIDELLNNAPGAEIVALIYETKDGQIKGSIRTLGNNETASKIAAAFGGGGHTRAAGFRTTDMDIAELEKKLLETVWKIQRERLSLDDK